MQKDNNRRCGTVEDMRVWDGASIPESLLWSNGDYGVVCCFDFEESLCFRFVPNDDKEVFEWLISQLKQLNGTATDNVNDNHNLSNLSNLSNPSNLSNLSNYNYSDYFEDDDEELLFDEMRERVEEFPVVVEGVLAAWMVYHETLSIPQLFPSYYDQSMERYCVRSSFAFDAWKRDLRNEFVNGAHADEEERCSRESMSSICRYAGDECQTWLKGIVTNYLEFVGSKRTKRPPCESPRFGRWPMGDENVWSTNHSPRPLTGEGQGERV